MAFKSVYTIVGFCSPFWCLLYASRGSGVILWTYTFKPDFPNLWQRLVRDTNKKIHALPERALDSFS